MKPTKLIVAISELWTDKQLCNVRNCLLRGFEEINKKAQINDIIEELSSKDIQNELELQACDVQILIDVTKATLTNVLNNSQSYSTLLLLYVGPVSVPWGHWLLSDGVVSATDVIQGINHDRCKLVMATLAPCDDWLATEKKHSDSVNVCIYDMVECGDPISLGLTDFIDTICHRLKVTPCCIKRPDSMSYLKAAEPSICGFLDRGCTVMPCLLLIDGFSMLLNVGYGRNPEVRHQLKYIAQVDAALLSHVGYNNILALSCTARDPESVKINHIFLPCGVNVHETVLGDSENPYTVDLNNELAKVVSGFKERGTSVSNLSIKGKSGVPLLVTAVKPIQLFHKIGYGSLELIPLAPFEDDGDVKKFADDMKKGKYVNETQIRALPSSLSVLVVWKPFNQKSAVRRLLYIGPKSQLRKNLPAVATTLYSNYDYLKQGDYTLFDKKHAARKSPAAAPITTTNATKITPKANGTSTEPIKKAMPVNEKSSRPLTATEPAKKNTAPVSVVPRSATANEKLTRPTTANEKPTRPATANEKPTRPATANVPPVTHQKPKETVASKRPNTATTKPKTDVTKSSDSTKTTSHDTKKVDVTKKAHDSKKDETSKVLDIKKPVNKSGDKTSIAAKKTVTKTDHHKEEEHTSTKVAITNGDNEHSKTTVGPMITADGDVAPECGKMVAVGTVECAITEHGEADFCDDTPEEFSADQMKEMGLYDEEEDRSSAPVSDRNELDSGECNAVAGANIAHLPMEGSYYGKETFEGENDNGTAVAWNQPLGMPMPMPVKDTNIGNKKSGKCATPIHVDCLCVPSDLDKDDLRCLFQYVRFGTGFLQLDKCSDLYRSMDILMEELGGCEGSTVKEVIVMPSVADEASMSWVEDNAARLTSCRVRVAPALSQCTILIGGEHASDSGDSACYGYRCDL